MYFVFLLCLVWALSARVLEWRRIRDLLPAALAAILLSSIPLALPGLGLPYTLTDAHLLTDHWAISFLLQIGLSPILAAWYAQGLPTAGRMPLVRWLTFGLLPFSLEWVAHLVGKVTYAHWWGPLHSLATYLFFGWVIFLVHTHTHACGSPQQKVDRSVREVRLPPVLPSTGPPDLGSHPMDH